MKKVILFGSMILLTAHVLTGCKRNDPLPQNETYPPEVAIEWMKLQMRLTMATPGFNSVVGGRSIGYAGLTLYESVVPGIKEGSSVASQLSNGNSLKAKLPNADKHFFYGPAAANAAMAHITKALFGNLSAANSLVVDSLEAAFKSKFSSAIAKEKLTASETFGKQVAEAIFTWSKDDGGHEAFLHVTDPSFTPPKGPGLWIPTPAAFSAPIHPRWGSNRSFVPGIVPSTQPPAPIPFSEETNSAYFAGAKELYDISLSLSHEDSTIAKFWGDLATNYNVPAHATGILNQLITSKGLKLDEAAIAYAKHGIAMSDALISVFKAKYTYTTIRPVSYIREVFKQPNWNTVIPTPPHPEYTAAHAVISAASATVMDDVFGKNVSFTDHTYDALYGPRTFSTFQDYAKEAGQARVLAGIHYRTSVMTGLEQGKKVGAAVSNIRFFKNTAK